MVRNIRKLFKKMLFVITCAFIASLVVSAQCFALAKDEITDRQCGVEASSNLVHHDPWVVFLQFHRRGRMTEIRCGGTLIDERHVVTAAHCVNMSKYSSIVARLGEYDVSKEIDCVEGVCADPIVRIGVADIIVHPDYDGKEHDIAILRLKEDAPYTDFIRPICLPSGPLSQDVTFAAAGWGEIPTLGHYSNTKKILPLPNWSRDVCQKAYRKTKLPDKVICAGGEEGVDTCRGDSGGPLAWIKGVAELWGVTSLGRVHCGAKGYPGIYTSVVDYLDWIKAVVSV